MGALPSPGSTRRAVTTVIFEDRGGKTLLNFHEFFPSKEAIEEALQDGAAALQKQLDELLASLVK